MGVRWRAGSAPRGGEVWVKRFQIQFQWCVQLFNTTCCVFYFRVVLCLCTRRRKHIIVRHAYVICTSRAHVAPFPSPLLCYLEGLVSPVLLTVNVLRALLCMPYALSDAGYWS